MVKTTARRKRMTLTAAAVAVIFIVIIASFAYRFITTFNLRKWDGVSNFIVLSVPDLSVTVYSPDSKTATSYVLPKDYYVTVPGGYGMYRLRDVAELSKTEKLEDKLVISTIKSVFGIPVDVNEEKMTDIDRLNLLYTKYQDSYEENTVHLEEKLIFTELLRPDGVTIRTIEPSAISYYFAEKLWERNIVNENLAIGIFNATENPGIASSVSRMLERIGMRVIDINNWNGTKPEKCFVKVKKEYASSITLKRIQKLFSCTVQADPDNRYDLMLIMTGEL